MLKSLSIKNYALIQHLVMEPTGGLNIITGETGAGKSIMLGALGLIMGKRADTRVLFNTDVKCVIEGIFTIEQYQLQDFFSREEIDYDEETIIRREINPSGKSRAFINDTPVTLDTLKQLSDRLMDIHSQHETLLLAQSGFQVELLDAFTAQVDERKAYTQQYEQYLRITRQLDSLNQQQEKIDKESDYKKFILNELEEADLNPAELEELEALQLRAEHAEEIKSSLELIAQSLQESDYSAASSLGEALQALRSIRNYAPELGEAFQRLDSAVIEINDIARQLQQQNDLVDFDPEEALRTSERLSMLYHLQQKHHVSGIEGLIGLREQLKSDLSHSESVADEKDRLGRELVTIEKSLSVKAKALSEKRINNKKALAARLCELLAKVGIGDAQVIIDIKPSEKLNRHGLDHVNLLFSANRGIAPQPLASAASGGEYSRLMFCIKYILADKIALPTIIFDEIDTGVSGEVAMKMGGMMKFMAQNHQVMAISHLPQIAARADRHYFVYKMTGDDNTVSNVKLLTEDERVVHIARMIGGNDPTETALNNARELLNHE